MPAKKLELKIRVERFELADAMRNTPIRDVGFVLLELSQDYSCDAPPGSPRAKFGKALRESLEILELGYSF